MPGQVTDIPALRAFAADVGAALPALRRAFPAASPTLDRVSAAASDLDTWARRPLTVAVVGEFSAGKSLLLGVLMGDACLLPVSEVPTTGNITALRLRPTAPDQAPGAGTVSVGFLSRPAAGELVEYLVGRIVAHVESNGLPYPVEMIKGARPTADADGWDRIDDFGRRVWGMTALNSKLKLTLHELVRLRDAWLAGQNLLPETDPGAEQPIARSDLDEAVTIGDTRTQPGEFPERRHAFPLPANARIDGDVLALMQPLIRRVTYEFAVRPDVWRFGPVLGEPGIEMLDMPGLSSAGGNRDEWLALRELRHVTTLLVVLNAFRPESDSVLDLPGFLEAARASREHLANSQLVVAQRFDTLPMPSDRTPTPEFASLKRMTSELSNQRPQLVTYASAMAAMAVRGMAAPRGLKLVPAQDLATARAYWAGVAQAEPGRDDATALRSLAADGGIDGLRAMIVSHVLAHGVDVHVTEMAARRDRICSELRLLPRGTTVAEPGEAEDRILRLAAALKESTTALRGRVRDLRRVDRLLTADGTALPDALRATVAGEVLGWDAWRLITGQVHHGVVERPRKKATEPDRPAGEALDEPDDEDTVFGDDWAPLEPAAVAEAAPSSSDRFIEPFRLSAEVVDAELERLLRDVVTTWTEGARASSAALDTVLAHDPSVLDLVAELTPGDPAAGRRRARGLAELTTLKFVPAMLGRSLRTVSPPTRRTRTR